MTRCFGYRYKVSDLFHATTSSFFNIEYIILFSTIVFEEEKKLNFKRFIEKVD